MRTTVELPPTLLRAAKARAAERGESLKTLFTRAVMHELGRSHAALDHQAVWPLIASGRKGTVHVTNDDLARIDASDDAAWTTRPPRRRR